MNRPLVKIFLFLILSLFIPYVISNYFGNTSLSRILLFFTIVLIFHGFIEIIFRFIFRNKYKEIGRYFLDDIYVEPHPYLPFILKKKHFGSKNKRTQYPLHSHFSFPILKTNNLRIFNGYKGSRNVKIPKPKGLIRINCIGASTTGNYIEENGKIYSYPLVLEAILKEKTKKNFEVNNFGFGGYNSNELFIRFNLQILDTNPDYIILMHGYNDIIPYFTSNFSSDYFNSRKSFAESYWKLLLISKLSKFPLKYIRVLLENWVPNFSVRNNILDFVTKGTLNLEQDPTQGLETYKRNIKGIIAICLEYKIKIILTSFSFYMYKEIKNNKLMNKFMKTVNKENNIVKELAEYYDLPFVDINKIIPKDDSYFVDSNHFTPKGMKFIADCISKKINLNN